MLKKVLLLLLLCPVMGHSAHITDKLLAGMYAEPNSANQPIQLLPSGTPVELMGEQNGFVKVQLVDGKTGWVEKRFLSEDKPAKVRLLALQSKYRQLQLKLDTAEKQLAGAAEPKKSEKAEGPDVLRQSGKGLQKELAQAKSDIARLEKELVDRTVPAMKEKAAVTQDELNAMGKEESVFMSGTVWVVVLLLLVVGVWVGVFMGVRLQDKRQMRKHGGFRI